MTLVVSNLIRAVAARPRRHPGRARQRRAAVLRAGPGRVLRQPLPAGRPVRLPPARRRPRPAGHRQLGRAHLRLDRLPERSRRRRRAACASPTPTPW